MQFELIKKAWIDRMYDIACGNSNLPPPKLVDFENFPFCLSGIGLRRLIDSRGVEYLLHERLEAPRFRSRITIMWKKTALIVGVVLVMAASTASASLVAVGDPIQGHSWGQGFEWLAEPGAQSFDELEVWVAYSTPANSVFLSNEPPSEPVLGSFTTAGWSLQETYADGTLTGATSMSTSVLAAGPYTKSLGFTAWFSGTNSNTDVLVVVEEGYGYSGGFATIAAGTEYWNGTTWTPTDYSSTEELKTFDATYVDPAGGSSVNADPEPVTLVIWGVLGVAGAAVVRRHKQPRGRWSQENRQAIFQVIERSR